MMAKKEKPIAILQVNEEIGAMTKREFSRLFKWIVSIERELLESRTHYGKCTFRLMKGGKK